MSSSASVSVRRLVPVLAVFALVFGAFAAIPAQAASEAKATTTKITGVVNDASGHPRAGVDVELQVDTPDGIGLDDETVTSATGAFSFNRTVGDRIYPYRIRVRDSGSFGEAYSSLFDAPGNFAVLPIATHPSASISGRVAEVGTDLPQSAHIVAHRVDGTDADPVVDSDGLDTTADPVTGLFSLTGLAANTPYRFELSPGSNHAPKYLGDAVRLSDADDIVIQSGDTPLGTIAVDKGATLSGVVQNDKGVGYPNAEVYVYDADADYSIDRLQNAELQEDGRWSLPALAAGDYKVEIQGDGFKYLDTFYDGATTLGESVPLQLGTGETKDLAPTLLELSSSITGKVKYGSTVLKGIKLNAHLVGSPAGSSEMAVLSKKDGTFVEKPLRAGTYQLVLSDPKKVYATTTSASFTVTGNGFVKPVGTLSMKLPAKVKVSASGGKGKATFAITVTASKVTPSGTVQVFLNGSPLKKATLKKGKASVTVTKQLKGAQTYTIKYSGNSLVSTATKTSNVTVK